MSCAGRHVFETVRPRDRVLRLPVGSDQSLISRGGTSGDHGDMAHRVPAGAFERQ